MPFGLHQLNIYQQAKENCPIFVPGTPPCLLTGVRKGDATGDSGIGAPGARLVIQSMVPFRPLNQSVSSAMAENSLILEWFEDAKLGTELANKNLLTPHETPTHM